MVCEPIKFVADITHVQLGPLQSEQRAVVEIFGEWSQLGAFDRSILET